MNCKNKNILIIIGLIFYFLVSINSAYAIDTSIDYTSYIKMLQKKVKSNWKLSRNRQSKHVTFLITILKDGNLKTSKIIESSGDSAFDASAQGAIDKTFPIQPFPIDAKENSLNIELKLDYNLLFH